jgi:hypothetical protein
MKAKVIQEHEIPDTEDVLVVTTCPVCKGVFGVDFAYLDQIDDLVSCPMCLTRVQIDMEEENGCS